MQAIVKKLFTVFDTDRDISHSLNDKLSLEKLIKQVN